MKTASVASLSQKIRTGSDVKSGSMEEKKIAEKLVYTLSKLSLLESAPLSISAFELIIVNYTKEAIQLYNLNKRNKSELSFPAALIKVMSKMHNAYVQANLNMGRIRTISVSVAQSLISVVSLIPNLQDRKKNETLRLAISNMESLTTECNKLSKTVGEMFDSVIRPAKEILLALVSPREIVHTPEGEHLVSKISPAFRLFSTAIEGLENVHRFFLKVGSVSDTLQREQKFFVDEVKTLSRGMQFVIMDSASHVADSAYLLESLGIAYLGLSKKYIFPLLTAALKLSRESLGETRKVNNQISKKGIAAQRGIQKYVDSPSKSPQPMVQKILQTHQAIKRILVKIIPRTMPKTTLDPLNPRK